MFYGPVHSAEECPTVLYQAMKVHLLKEVTLSFTEVICVKPLYGRIEEIIICKCTAFSTKITTGLTSHSFYSKCFQFCHAVSQNKFQQDWILYTSEGFQVYSLYRKGCRVI